VMARQEGVAPVEGNGVSSDLRATSGPAGANLVSVLPIGMLREMTSGGSPGWGLVGHAEGEMAASHGLRCWRVRRLARGRNVGAPSQRAFREELLAVHDKLCRLSERTARRGVPVGPARALEILVWTEVEPRAYYRK
jgi:hypothetical protein